MSRLSYSSTHQIFLPAPSPSTHHITGTLERKAGPDVETTGRPIALVLHGSMGHRSYLYQRTLPSHLPIDSFRFDFRSNNDSPGPPWAYAGFTNDLEDLRVVVKWLREEWGYVVVLLVGHSRGSVVGMTWCCEDGRGVKGYVNVSGRYRMEKVYDLTKHYLPSFSSHGYYDWHVTVNKRPVVARITPSDIDAFAALDTSVVRTRFPKDLHVLTVHGIMDKVVPVYDGVIYSRIYSARTPGTHTLHLIEEADHNLIGHFEEVNSTIAEWWSTVEEGSVKGGWAPAWEERRSKL